MNRRSMNPRQDWQARVEEKGMVYHTAEDGTPYWDESACYEFTAAEVDALEKATYTLNDLCLAAVECVIQKDYFERFGIPPQFVEWVKASWERDEQTLLGRFDLALWPDGQIKLLEYNADTPTALLEAAVIQWFWMQDVFPTRDQFNNIHDRLLEAWLAIGKTTRERWYFASLSGEESPEDFMTVSYLRDTALQAKLETDWLALADIGYNRPRATFVDGQDRPLQNCFKLYPWEWMLREEFGPMLLRAPTNWLEPPWKMILSNKAILAVLWELFEGNELLLETGFEQLGGAFVRKPIYSREGANIQIVRNGRVEWTTPGQYGGPFVYQRLAELPQFDGNYPVIGSWMINGYAAGMGIREDRTPITGNLSRFVPHVFG